MALKFLNDGYFAGEVGIGTASPITKFQITATNASSPTANIFLDIDGSNVPGMGGQIIFGASTSANLAAYIARIQGVRSALDNGSSDLHFQTTHVAAGTGPSTKMTILSDGKVGIGTTGPTASLHVLGNVVFDSYSLTDPAPLSRTAYPAAQMFTHYSEANGVSIIGGQAAYNGCGLTIGEETTASSNFKFIRGVSDTNGGSNAAEEFWVNGIGGAYFAGNVGIGTASPDSQLEVYYEPAGSTGAQIKLGSGDVGYETTITNYRRTTDSTFEIASYDDTILGYNRSTDKTWLGIGSDVGIGTTSPSYKLHSTGTIGIAGNTLNNAIRLSINESTTFPGSNSSDTRLLNFVGGNGGSDTEIGGVRWLNRDGNSGNYQYHAAGITSHNANAINSGDLRFFVSNNASADSSTGVTEAMRVSYEGNVGIGTTDPSQKLTIRDDSTAVYSTGDADTNTGDLVLQNNDETDDNFNRISFQSNSGNNQTGDLLDAARITAIYPDHAGANPSGELAFETKADAGGMAEAMRIDRDGKVGIGTNNPSRLLSISSNDAATTPQLLITQNGSGDAVIGFNRPGHQGWAMGIDSSLNNNFEIHNSSGGVDSSSQFAITPTGNVGIGTISPLEELDVRSTSFSTVAVSTDRNTATENIGSFAFYGQNDATTPGRLLYTRIMSSMPSVTDGAESGDIYFQQIDNGTVGETVRILSSGNVGIGTNNPAAPLQVGSITATTQSQVTGEVQIVGSNYDISDTQMGTLNLTSTSRRSSAPFNQGYGPSITFSQNGSGYVNGWEKVIGGIKTEIRDAANLDYASDMKFYTHNNTALEEQMRIDANGNVGINTSGLTAGAPDLLTISGDAKYIAHYDGTNYAFKLGADSSGDGNFQLYSSDSTVRVKLYGELNAANYINNNGNFGIGDSSPLARLHVREEDTLGIKTVYGSAIIEATDAQLDLLSTSSGTWGSAINFVESNGVDANTDVWSIARQTTGGNGDSRLSFNFGTVNQHQNTAQVIFASDGTVTSNHGTVSSDSASTLTTKSYVDSLITGATIYRGTWNPDASLNSGYGAPDLSGVTQTSGYYYICSADGAAYPNGTTGTPAVPCEPDSWSTGDWVIWNDDVADCAGTGTGAWQKIDNSSVLSGVGTGTKIAKWAGASTITDSDTLENSIISDLTTSIDVDGGVTADYFRTDETTTEYSLISRNSAGNSPLYVQSANSDTNQWIARFSHGSATPNGGTNVLTVGKDISYFNDTKLGIGTISPGTINGTAFSGVGLHVASTGIGRTITSGATWAEYILNDEGADVDERAKFMESNQGVLSFGSYDDDGTQRTALNIKNNGQVRTLYNLEVGDGTKTGGDNMYIRMGFGLDVYVNREFDFDPQNTSPAILLLCAYAPYNNVNGSVQMDRTSGLRHSCRADIVISAGSGTNPIGVMKATGVSGAGEPSYRLVKFNKVGDTIVYIGLEITNPDLYYENTGAYFNGRLTSTEESLVAVVIGTATGQAENITAFEENGIHDFHGDVEIQGNLAVSGQVDGDLTIADDLTVVDQLTVGGVTTLNDPLNVNVDLATAYTTTGFNDVGIVLRNQNTDNVAGMYSTIVLTATGWEGTTTGVAQLNVIQEGSNLSNGTFTIKVRDNGSHFEAFRIKHNGNVGIGSNDPDYLLDLYQSTGTNASTTGTTMQRLWNYVGSDINQQKTFIDFVFQDDNANEYPQVRIGAEVGQNGNASTQTKEGSGAFVVYTNNATGDGPGSPTGLAERFRVDYAGNVGIGTASPSRNLQVKGTANTSIAITAPTTGLAQLALGDTDDDNYAQIILDNSTNKLQIQNGGGGIVSNRGITLDSSENVGIGTDSPVSPLTIKSSSVSSGESALTIQANASTNTIVKLGERSGGRARLEMYDSGVAKIAFYTDGNHNYINTGKVAIGTTNPGAKLHIDGDLIITDTPQGQGDFLTVNPVSGKVTSVSSKDVSFGEAYINNYRSRVLDYGGSYFPTGAAGNVAKHKSNNLFNLMSMMLLPGGVFSGKVTAAKPKTGVDFTWTRTTVANYTNEEGVITEAPIATPRIDFANNSNGEILIEPTRTNLVPNSGPGDYGNTPGSTTTVPGPNGVYNSAIVPVPNSNADRYQYTIAANTHSDGDVFTYSWYRRRVSTPVQDVFVGDLNVSGLLNCTLTGATAQIESNISGFDRFACQITLGQGNTDATVRGYFGALIGIGNSSIAYFGQQLELGDFATTLINTTGSAVTRDNDYMVVNNLSDTIFEGMVGQGGMYMDFDYKREGDSDGLRFHDENNVTPRVYLYQGSTGISDSWSAGAFTLNQTSGNKIGYMFTSTTSAVYCANGANVVTSSPTAAQALDTPLDTLYIDGNQNLVRIRELSMFTQMTSAQLVTLTTL